MRLRLGLLHLAAFLLPGLVGSGWPTASFAATQQTLHIGLDLFDFDYREFNDAGSLLDRESGPLPGLALRWERTNGDRIFAIESEFHFGDVEYDGQTQSGVPFLTDTRTRIFGLRLMSGRRFGAPEARQQRFYAGLGYHYWFRDILSGTASDGSAVAGLLETYQWFYLLIGADFDLWRQGRHRLRLDARYRTMLLGTMEVDFQGYSGYDNTDVVLGRDDGLRLALVWQWRWRADETLVFEPYFSAWDIGRSNLAALTRNGTATGDRIYEPRSETRNIGLRILYRHQF